MTLYLKGIASGLSPNEPLLAVAGTQKVLLRVLEVTPDAAADRTAVDVEFWLTEQPLDARERLRRIVAAGRSLTPVSAVFEALRGAVDAGGDDAELTGFIEEETVPSIDRALRRANVSAAAKSELRALRTEIVEAAATMRGDEPSRGTTAGSFERGGSGGDNGGNGEGDFDELGQVVPGLTKAASVPPASSQRLRRDAGRLFKEGSDLGIQAFGHFRPLVGDQVPVALANTTVTSDSPLEIYAFRVKAGPFGQSAPLRSEIVETRSSNGATEIRRSVAFSEWTGSDVQSSEEMFEEDLEENRILSDVIHLDGGHDKILPDSWIVIDSGAVDLQALVRLSVPHHPLLFARAGDVKVNVARAAYGTVGKATRVELKVPNQSRAEAAWFGVRGSTPPKATGGRVDDFQIIRRTVAYAAAEKLDLAEEPVDEPICDGTSSPIVLDGVYSDLKSGRWVIVAGERADIQDASGAEVRGVRSSELAMLAEVLHTFDRRLPGDSVHTRITLAEQLSYCYRRDSVSIYANVVKATNGETRRETMGSGDGSKPLQRFALRQPPLTYVSARTPEGVESTLKVFVNDVQWREAETFLGLQPVDRRFVTMASDEGATTVVFGNGQQGSRLPTGLENVRAEYRQGLGKAGNVRAGQLSLLAAKPLGV